MTELRCVKGMDMRTKRISMWRLIVLSMLGRIRRNRRLRRGSLDWIACAGRPFSAVECVAFTRELRRASEPVRRLQEERLVARRGVGRS